MDDYDGLFIGFIIFGVGFLMIKSKDLLGRKAAGLYRKIGIDVPDQLYAKQFFFIGVLSVILGFVVGIGLLRFLF